MFYLLTLFCGLALGSFVNALVWRIYMQEKSRKKNTKLSILNGRSMCTHCRHELGPLDLIPVLSWISLKGKCRYCRKPIGKQYVFVEVATALLFIASLLLWPYGFSTEGIVIFVAWLLLLTGLIALAVYDIRWMLLPNRIVYPLIVFWLSVIGIRVVLFDGGLSLIIGAFIGLIICGGLFWVLFEISDGTWIGGGDVKLGFLLGLLVAGALPAIMVIFLASLLGTIWVLPQMMNKKIGMKAQVPFGPFLIAAGIAVFLLGENYLELLSNLLLV